ncbi:uncharacterized protein BXZ73DRAFT_6978, partial [Epithele typhae]|uniref:uncharacterized protein n=1 Tax=Epithele typhae TaxID=378194 RepID=UPI002007316D
EDNAVGTPEPGSGGPSRRAKRALRYRDGDSSSDEEEPDRKKSKPVDRSTFAWVINPPLTVTKVSPIVKRLEKQYRMFARDIKTTLTDLLNTPGIPELPISEWENILRGRTVDLDQVFSGRYSTSPDEKQKHKFSEGVEISLGTSRPSKTVKGCGDWLIAWQEASAAYSAVLPELAPVCAAYGKHITGQFASLHSSLSNRVLDYDRAVRKRVALNRQLLFSDTYEFNDLRIQFTDSGGANVLQTVFSGSGSRRSRANSSRGTNEGSAGSRGSSDDICRRFNKNLSHESPCKYKHVCSACRGAHTRSQCPSQA